MSDNSKDDRFRDISEIIRKLMEQTMSGQESPVTFSVNFIITNGVPGGRNSRKTVEPETEIYSVSDRSYIIADMPGVSEENIDLKIGDSDLLITGQTGERIYSKRIDLPSVEEGSMQYTCKNGVLEISFKISTTQNKAEDPEARDGDCMQDHL